MTNVKQGKTKKRLILDLKKSGSQGGRERLMESCSLGRQISCETSWSY